MDPSDRSVCHAALRELEEETGLRATTEACTPLCLWESCYPTTIEGWRAARQQGTRTAHFLVAFVAVSLPDVDGLTTPLRLQPSECDLATWVRLRDVATVLSDGEDFNAAAAGPAGWRAPVPVRTPERRWPPAARERKLAARWRRQPQGRAWRWRNCAASTRTRSTRASGVATSLRCAAWHASKPLLDRSSRRRTARLLLLRHPSKGDYGTEGVHAVFIFYFSLTTRDDRRKMKMQGRAVVAYSVLYQAMEVASYCTMQ